MAHAEVVPEARKQKWSGTQMRIGKLCAAARALVINEQRRRFVGWVGAGPNVLYFAIVPIRRVTQRPHAYGDVG
jgi:hypothetical protein